MPNNIIMADAKGSSDGHVETGTVSIHTGEVVSALSIPISPTAQALESYTVYVRPIKTWVLENGVWVERGSLDFTGTTGFNTGNWNPLVIGLVGQKIPSPADTKTYRLYACQSQYSNGTGGNRVTDFFTVDSENNLLLFSSFNGGKVCTADCGITFEYTIREARI